MEALGFSFAVGEHWRHLRVALAAARVGSAAAPCAEPPVAACEGSKLAPAP